ncbi:HDOD domain-containing protein [Chromobacterium haemolyticum]|nr:HDOD domain-containing protein [Chromobacterium haemolyticum]
MANAAKRLARLAKLDPQLGYTCGLLSNIGELVLYVAVPEQALQIDRIVAGGADRVATERMLLGMDLTEVGAELARRWNFPDEIQEAIFNQHDLLNEEVSPFALLIGLASFMTSGFNHDMSEEDMLATLPVSVMERAGLPAPRGAGGSAAGVARGLHRAGRDVLRTCLRSSELERDKAKTAEKAECTYGT